MSASLLLHKVVGFPVLFLAAAVFTTTDSKEVVAVEQAVAFDTQAVCLALTLTLVVSRLWYAGWGVAPLQPLYGLLVLTAGYYAASIAGAHLLDGQADDDLASMLQLPSWSNAAVFSVISFFRWAADASIVFCAFATMAEARARLAFAKQKAAERRGCKKKARSTYAATGCRGEFPNEEPHGGRKYCCPKTT